MGQDYAHKAGGILLAPDYFNFNYLTGDYYLDYLFPWRFMKPLIKILVESIASI